MASNVDSLVRLLGGRPATPAEWGIVVQAARGVLPALGTTELALPDDLVIVQAGVITAALPSGGVAMLLPETEMGPLAASSGPGHAAAVATLWHELAHVAVLRRLPPLVELDESGLRDMEAVALAAQSRVLAHVLATGTWQQHLATILASARIVAETVGDPLLQVYEEAGAALLGELGSLPYPVLVERVAERLRPT